MSAQRPTLDDMAPEVADVLETAKSLNRDQIADLAYHLLQVLDDDLAGVDQARIDAAWRADLRRRTDEIENGRVQLVDGPETLAMARAMLAKRRT